MIPGEPKISLDLDDPKYKKGPTLRELEKMNSEEISKALAPFAEQAEETIRNFNIHFAKQLTEIAKASLSLNNLFSAINNSPTMRLIEAAREIQVTMAKQILAAVEVVEFVKWQYIQLVPPVRVIQIPEKSISVENQPLKSVAIREEMLKPTVLTKDEKTYVLDGIIDKISNGILEKLDNNVSFITVADGQIFCDGRIVDFPTKNAIHVWLVEAILFRANHRGFCSYDEIDDFLVKERNAGKVKNRAEARKRINNAILTLYRKRRDQRCDFPEFAPDQRKVITIEKGKGIFFHNPRTSEYIKDPSVARKYLEYKLGQNLLEN